MVLTRSSSSASARSDEDSIGMEDSPSSGGGRLPLSDSSRDVRVVIAPKAAIDLPIYRLPSPKSGGSPALYMVGKDYCGEIVQSATDYRSWFYGEDVVEDGSIRMYSPLHPLFLVLPSFCQNRDKFQELSEILSGGLDCLLENAQLQRTLDCISDLKEVCDTKVYRYNEEKTLEWLKARLERVKSALLEEGTLHKSILADADALIRYSFGILGDYLSAELCLLAKERLAIPDAPTVASSDDKTDYSYKRRTDDELFPAEKAKKQKESVVKKQLAQASKGTKSISSFFGKK